VSGGFRVGQVVRVERDETRYPSRGTWPRYRGRVGTVIRINTADRKIGVTFEAVDPARVADPAQRRGIVNLSWFGPHELVHLESRPVRPGSTRTATMHPDSPWPGNTP
jgi:hypothetical protein